MTSETIYFQYICSHCPWRYRIHRHVPPHIDYWISRYLFTRHIRRNHPGYLEDLQRMGLM